MKITAVNTVLLTGPCTNDPFLSECRRHRSAAFIEIHTDAGLVGIGDSYNGYRCAELYPAAVEIFAPILIGKTVDDVPQLWQWMYQCEHFWCRSGFGIGVINGIEAALWDLKGKAENKPVYELLGGLKHESLAAYATGGPSNYPKERLAAKIDHYLSLGFRGFKLATGVLTDKGFEQPLTAREAAQLEADKLRFIRERYGSEVTVCLDGHMGNRHARVLPPTKPGLGITLSDDVKRRFPFIPGSAEFNDVPAKSLADWENRVDEQIAGVQRIQGNDEVI